MGDCIYCGKKAGFFRTRHKECWNKYTEGSKVIKNIVHDAFLHNKVENVKEQIDAVAKGGFIDQQKERKFVIEGWIDSVNTAFDDGILTEEEEKSLMSIAGYFDLSQDDLNNKDVYTKTSNKGAYTKVVQGSILRSVMNGEVPEKISVEDPLPFNFQKSEQLIWAEENVKYYETKVKTKYVGGSGGVSIRIAKGIYYRTSSFKGEKVQYHEMSGVDTGILAVTNKHIYFGGDFKSFRVPFSKIVSFTPYSEGFGIQRDAASAKPQTFFTGDGWFFYNLLSNISNIS